jgi:Tol biopolymer transport system component
MLSATASGIGGLMAGEIFISYRRADQAWARLLHAQLRAEGIEAWYDAHVGPGDDWRIATATALKASRIFVLLFSSSAAQSTDIAKELAAAVFEKKLIIPVRLEDIAPDGAFLYELASRNWINAYENTEAKLAELAKGLAQIVRSRTQDESVLPFDRSDDGRISPQKRLRKPALIAAAAIFAIAATAIAAWLLWPAQRWTVESSRPFISTLALEGEPAFSSDGKMLAYSSGTDPQQRKIYVRNAAGGNGIKITGDAYDDVSPSWSPDGTRLAYVAQKTGEPCHIMVTTVPAGEAREVGRCAREETGSVSWQPGTSFLYYHDRAGLAGDVIVRLDLDTGAKVQITGRKTGTNISPDIRCSPDGKSLAYLLLDNFKFQIYHIVIHDLASGRETLLGDIHDVGSADMSASIAWSEDARTVFASVASGIGSQILAYPVSGGAPYTIYTTAVFVRHLSAGGGSLALETDPSRINLARAHPAPFAQPDNIDPANGMTWSPSFARDGTLVFLSNRSGTNAIWIMKPGAAPALLFDGGLAPLFRVALSPDGTRLALVVTSPNGLTVRILSADGASLNAFDIPTVGFGLPAWTPDSKAITVFDLRIFRALRIDANDPSRRSPIAPAYWDGVTVRDDGTFAVRYDRDGVWQIDKGIRLISPKWPSRLESPLTFRGDDMLIPDFKAPGGPRILAQPLAGGPDRVLAYAPGAGSRRDYPSSMAVNPKTGEVIYVAEVMRDTNIDLLNLTRTGR